MRKLCVAFLLIAPGAMAGEIRMVGGRSVDLTPLIDWLETHNGERPLTHWKQIQVLEFRGTAGGNPKCLAKTDQGKREIIVANLPREVNSFFQSVAQQQNALVKLRNDLVAARAQYQKARSLYLNENLGDYVSVTAGSSGTRVDSEAARRQRYHQSEARVAALERTLEEQEKAFEKQVEGAVGQTTVLAMFTGRKFANLEVWDCGTKK